MVLSHECMFLSSLSRHNKDLERQTLKPSASHSSRVLDSVIALRQICVTALFYLEDSRRIHPQSVRACQPKDLKRREWRSAWEREEERERERERERKNAQHAGERERERASKRASKALAPPLMFFLPLGLPYANWA